MAKVKALCRRTGTSLPLDTLLIGLNQMLRGWCEHFRPGVSSATFQYVSSHVWKRVMKWLKRKHRRTSWKELRHRYCHGQWWPASNQRELFDPAKVRTTRYRYREQPSPRPGRPPDEATPHQPRDGTRGAPGAGKLARRVRESGPRKPTGRKARTALRADFTTACSPISR